METWDLLAAAPVDQSVPGKLHGILPESRTRIAEMTKVGVTGASWQFAAFQGGHVGLATEAGPLEQ